MDNMFLFTRNTFGKTTAPVKIQYIHHFEIAFVTVNKKDCKSRAK
jgi:hypothetical protein